MDFLKNAFFSICRCLGLFWLARKWFRKRLLIIGYHAFEQADESMLSGMMFISTDLLEQRLEYLRKAGYRFLSLDDALVKLKQNQLPDHSVVITIDDGFYSALKLAGPLLTRLKIPATLYLTSYYADKGSDVFGLAVRYILAKSNVENADVNSLPIPQWLIAKYGEDVTEVQIFEVELIRYGEGQLSDEERTKLLDSLAECFEVSLEDLRTLKSFKIVGGEDIRQFQQHGIDVQLHTHRHRLPIENGEVEREILDNRSYLTGYTDQDLVHFCYPSGIWSPEHPRLLAAQGVKSAVTCDPGFNDENTSPLALYRFIDGSPLSQLEFEAEVSGVRQILRKLFGRSAEQEIKRLQIRPL